MSTSTPVSVIARVWVAAALASVTLACGEIDRARWKARFGDVAAQMTLAAAYAQGAGVEKDATEAIR